MLARLEQGEAMSGMTKGLGALARRMVRMGAAALLLTAALSAAPALAAPAASEAGNASILDHILASHVLRVGTTGDYKPFTYRDPKSGTYQGIDIDMAAALGKSLGAKVEFVPTTWKTMMGDLLAGKFDIAMGGVTITLPRERTAFFSSPYFRDGKTPIARCADKTRYETLAEIDRPDVRVIVNPGGTNESFVRAHIHHAKIIVYKDNVTIFNQILANKADVMITDGVETLLQQKLHPGLCAIHPDKPFNVAEKGYLLPRDLVWQEYVDQWLRQMKIGHAYQAIRARWLD